MSSIHEKQGTNQRSLDDHRASLRATLEMVKGKKHFFFLTIFLTALGTFVGHHLQVSTYNTNSSIFVQNIDQPSAAEYLLNQSAFRLSRVDRIESYVNHLKSDSFYLRIAEKLKFHPEFESLELSSPRQKSKLKMSYWTKKLLKSPEPEVTTKKSILLTPVEDIVGFLKGSLKFHTDYSSQFIEIRTMTIEPRTAQLIANLVAQEFVALTNMHSSEELQEIETFVQSKMQSTEEQVMELDKQLIGFKKKHNIISADQTTKSLAQRLSSLESEIEIANLQWEENDKLIASFKKGRQRALQSLIAKGSQALNTPETQHLIQKRIDFLRQQKSAFFSEGYKPGHFKIQQLDGEINKAVSQLKQVLNGDFNDSAEALSPIDIQERMAKLTSDNHILNQKISTLKKARNNLQGKVSMMPQLQQQFIKIQNQFKLEVETLASLKRKEKELEIQRISQKKEVRVDQLAPLPGPSPRGSLAMKLLFSSFVAIFLGVLIILGLEAIDPTIKRRQDLFDCGVEFFGEVPLNKESERAHRKKMDFGCPEDLVCLKQADSIDSMAFKYIRARIESMRYKQKKYSQIIALSSAMNDEGKSYVTANLAISLAQLERKTILIDADLRRPSQAAYFGLSSQSGLIDLLTMRKSLDEVVVTSQMPHLDVLPAEFSGTNVTEIISSQKFRVLLDFLRTKYEYIVIDTPPTFAVVDPAIVASYCDIPILVSSYRETRKTDFSTAYNDLLQVSYKKVYGIINKALVSNSRIHYYGYRSPDEKALGVLKATETSPADNDTNEFLESLNKKSS